MATYVWTLQGTTGTTIDATDRVQFAGSGGFGTAVTVSSYQDTTHVESSGGANDSSGNTPHNNKYLTSTTVSLNGAGSTTLSAASTAASVLKVNFAHGSSVATSAHKFYAYDGTTTTAVPTAVTFRVAEQADTNWINAEGSAAALTLGNTSAATSHDFFLLLSASPESVGLKTAFKLRDELTYQ